MFGVSLAGGIDASNQELAVSVLGFGRSVGDDERTLTHPDVDWLIAAEAPALRAVLVYICPQQQRSEKIQPLVEIKGMAGPNNPDRDQGNWR